MKLCPAARTGPTAAGSRREKEGRPGGGVLQDLLTLPFVVKKAMAPEPWIGLRIQNGEDRPARDPGLALKIVSCEEIRQKEGDA